MDIQSEFFSTQYPHLDWNTLNGRIHGYLAGGRLISGLDVTYFAWKLVGYGWLFAPLRWPVICWFADFGYHVFAKHRYRISYLLTGKKRCDPCKTTTGKPDE